jgi:glycosyltransferase involved in cell wall biosynthesis
LIDDHQHHRTPFYRPSAAKLGTLNAPMHGLQPAFSVLIATYNHEAYLLEALESVATQSFKDYEIVIIDDGSTDRTPELLAAWKAEFAARRSNRVVIVRTENGGQSRAYEHGLYFCEGQYISLLDSDDRWMPDKLEAVHEVAINRPAAVMICHPVAVMNHGGTPTGQIRPSRAQLSQGDLRARIRRTGRTVAAVTSGVTIRANVLRELLPMPTKRFSFGADGYITTGASLRGPVEVVRRPLALYRVHPSGQYFARMLSKHGPRLTMEHQLVVARHFGLENAIRRSSYFGRHAFAAAKLEGEFLEQVRSYGCLVRSTVLDEAFTVPERLALAAFWTVCLAIPRRSFFRLWKWFQLWHIGWTAG